MGTIVVANLHLSPESPRSSNLWGEGRGCPDSSFPTQTQSNHPLEPQVSLVASMKRRGQAVLSWALETMSCPYTKSETHQLRHADVSWTPRVYLWTVYKCVPETSTQAMSMCFLGAHLSTPALYISLFIYVCICVHIFYLCVHCIHMVE